MKGRHSCLSGYLAYIVVFIGYFVVGGSLMGALFPDVDSELSLVVLNGASAVLSVSTVIAFKFRGRIAAFMKRLLRGG